MSQAETPTAGEPSAEPVPVPATAPLPLAGFPANPFEGPSFRQRKHRPLLGGSLWIYGALFWAYLVMGELIVNVEVNELFGALVVIAALAVAWRGAIRDVFGIRPRVAPGAIAIGLFVVTLFVTATLFGTSRRSSIAALTVAFLIAAVASYIGGRRLIASPKRPPSRSRLAATITLWVFSGLGTAVALLSALSKM